MLRQSTVHPCLFEQGRGVMRGTRPLQGRISLHSRAHTRLRAARRSFAAALAAASCSADSSRGARCAACQPASNANSFGSVRLFMDPSATRALRSVGSTPCRNCRSIVDRNGAKAGGEGPRASLRCARTVLRVAPRRKGSCHLPFSSSPAGRLGFERRLSSAFSPWPGRLHSAWPSARRHIVRRSTVAASGSGAIKACRCAPLPFSIKGAVSNRTAVGKDNGCQSVPTTPRAMGARTAIWALVAELAMTPSYVARIKAAKPAPACSVGPGQSRPDPHAARRRSASTWGCHAQPGTLPAWRYSRSGIPCM